MRWRFIEHPDLRIVRFGAEAVVFNPLSWETHLLNETAAHIVDALRRGLQDADALATDLTAALDPAGSPEAYTAQIEGLLEELEGLGLVDREPADGREPDSREPCPRAELTGARE
ncbi:MAG: HPr-rel-A system PqqD family peptide chaperone [Burkholderiales bacterium]|nr:HPr-rel-A system PqqD family peptide chaperone [Burkholderiales bacterium]